MQVPVCWVRIVKIQLWKMQREHIGSGQLLMFPTMLRNIWLIPNIIVMPVREMKKENNWIVLSI